MSILSSVNVQTIFFNEAPVGFMVVNGYGIITSINPFVSKLLGYKNSQLIGKYVIDLYANTIDGNKKAIKLFDQKFSKGLAIKNEELQMKRSDGSIIWINLNVSPVRNDEGIIIESRSIICEITENMNSKNKLRESEEKYKNLVETSQDLIWQVDKEGKFTYLNKAWEVSLGYSLEELYGKKFSDFKKPDLIEKDLKTFQNNLKGGNAKDYHTIYLSKSGKEVHLRFNSITFTNISGEVIGTQGTAHDVTELKLAEKEQIKINERIQHIQKMESLGILAGGVAHDFNNLLTGIMGNTSLALFEIANESPIKPYLIHIQKTTERAAELTKQMLAYSGKGRFTSEICDLNILIEEMLYLLKASIPKNVFLKYNYSENLPMVEIDSTQIRQVIMNLIINSSEALENKSGVISLSTGIILVNQEYLSSTYTLNDIDEGTYVYFEISDTGIGIDKQIIDQIFDPFFSTKFTGRGLGLAAVLGIIKGHNGAIKVHSEINKGSTFKIILPITKKLPHRVDSLEIQQLQKGKGTILVCDDEKSVRIIAKKMLEHHEFSVILASNGRDAIEVFQNKQNEIDLVILDMMMPYLNGFEVFRELRLMKPDVKIILSSGYNEHETLKQFSGKKVSNFIQKPYSFEKFISKVYSALNNKTGYHQEN